MSDAVLDIGIVQPMAPAQIGVNGIAVVDIAYIFKKHNRFDQEMKTLKQRVEAAEADLKRMGEEIKKKQDQLKAYDQQKTFPPGSPEYKRLEEQILKDTGEFNLKRSLQGKEFMAIVLYNKQYSSAQNR